MKPLSNSLLLLLTTLLALLGFLTPTIHSLPQHQSLEQPQHLDARSPFPPIGGKTGGVRSGGPPRPKGPTTPSPKTPRPKLPTCNKGPEKCNGDAPGPSDPDTFADAPEKAERVEKEKEKEKGEGGDPPDSDDADFCGAERCQKKHEHCVKIKGRQDSPLPASYWKTCCPKNFKLAGRNGKCCNKVDKKGRCIK